MLHWEWIAFVPTPYCLPTSLDLAPVFSGHALSCGWSRHLVVGTLSFVLSLCWFLLIWTKRGVRKIGEKDCALQSQLGVCNQFTCFKIQLHMLQLGFHFIFKRVILRDASRGHCHFFEEKPLQWQKAVGTFGAMKWLQPDAAAKQHWSWCEARNGSWFNRLEVPFCVLKVARKQHWPELFFCQRGFALRWVSVPVLVQWRNVNNGQGLFICAPQVR